MKKTTLYTLLCTTILASTISNATEESDLLKTPAKGRLNQLQQDQSQPGTPITNETKKLIAEAKSGLPTTPQIAEQQRALYAQTTLDEGSKAIFASAGTALAKAQRDEKLNATLREIRETETKQRVSRANAAKDLAYAEENERYKKELEALEAKGNKEISAFEAQILRYETQIADLTQQLLAASQSKETILAERTKLEQDIKDANQFKNISQETLQRLVETLAKKTQELTIAEQKERSTREALLLAQHERDQEKKAKEALAEGIHKLSQAKKDATSASNSTEGPVTAAPKAPETVVAPAVVAAGPTQTAPAPVSTTAPAARQRAKATFGSGDGTK